MTRDKIIAIGVVVLGGLGLLVYRQAKRDESLGAPAPTIKELPSINAPADIDKISITNGDKGEVLFEKVVDPNPGDASAEAGPPMIWVMTKPLNAPLNQGTIKDIVANLEDIKVDSEIYLTLDDSVRKDKQLDAAHGVHVVAWRGSDKKLDDVFGKSGPAGQLVTVGSKPDQVWAAKDYKSYLYTKEPKDFRNKEILKFEDNTVSRVTVTNSSGTFSFTKGDKWAATRSKKPLAGFDEEKLKDMLRSWKSLNADDFGDGKSAADVGLNKPEATVSIELADGAGAFTVLVGGTASGTNRWAKRSSDDTIFQIASYMADWALTDGSKFLASADAGAGAGDGGSKVKPGPAGAKKK
ncbi:MAG: DUF4340 domain-containing protein [Polyangiaceae bacterium]|jgi:hypothetical protein